MRSSYPAFSQLMKQALLSFRREFAVKLFDTFCMFFTIVIVFCYFMPQEGVREGYASFFLIGAIASFGFIEIVGKVGAFMADLQGDRAISHSLVMPIRPDLVFIYIGLQWALTSAFLSIFLFPLGKLLLFKGFDLSLISYPHLIPMFVTTNLFFGYFALWLASVIKDVSNLTSLWVRYISPIWMFGAYFYSWEAAYSLSPVIGVITLLNPMTYVMEGMRAATLGQTGYLPYAFSLVMLWGFIVICTWHAIRRLKKRLDCV